MAERMPPPGMGKKPGLMIAVGVGKPSGGGEGRMPPPGGPDKASPPMDEPEGPAGKHSEAEAHPVRANEHCKDCRNWVEMDGSCKEVEGSWEPEDACVKFFEPMGSEDPDEAPEDPDSGMPSDSATPSIPKWGSH